MLDYLIFPSANVAIEVSQELFKLSRPVSHEGDVTSLALSVQEHPSSGEAAIEYMPNYFCPIHPGHNTARLGELMAPLFESEAEREQLKEYISNSSSITLEDILPVSVHGLLKTHEGMLEDGWFKADI